MADVQIARTASRSVLGSMNDIAFQIRTRADLSRWGAANARGREMHRAVDVLEQARATTDAAEFYAVAHAALASAVKVIARADDSSGIIGDACRRLLDMHPRALWPELAVFANNPWKEG